jgi:hypothetical protein
MQLDCFTDTRQKKTPAQFINFRDVARKIIFEHADWVVRPKATAG